MTDDIVARLREFTGPQYPDDICGKAAMGEAADEIERLRALMQEIYSLAVVRLAPAGILLSRIERLANPAAQEKLND